MSAPTALLLSTCDDAKNKLRMRESKIHSHNAAALALGQQCDRTQDELDKVKAKEKAVIADKEAAQRRLRAAHAHKMDRAHAAAQIEAKKDALANAAAATREDLVKGDSSATEEAGAAFQSFVQLLDLMATDPETQGVVREGGDGSAVRELRAQIAREESAMEVVREGVVASVREIEALEGILSELREESEQAEVVRRQQLDELDLKRAEIDQCKRNLCA